MRRWLNVEALMIIVFVYFILFLLYRHCWRFCYFFLCKRILLLLLVYGCFVSYLRVSTFIWITLNCSHTTREKFALFFCVHSSQSELLKSYSVCSRSGVCIKHDASSMSQNTNKTIAVNNITTIDISKKIYCSVLSVCIFVVKLQTTQKSKTRKNSKKRTTENTQLKTIS